MVCNRQKDGNLYKADLKALIEYKREENGDRLVSIIKGVLSTSRFYKLEEGQYIDDKIVVDRILKRVGINPGEVEMIILQKDAQRYILREKIYKAYNARQYDETERLLKIYNQETSDQHKIHRQFMGKMAVLIMMQKKANKSLIISMLRQMICYTIPEFEIKPLKAFCLAPEEMELCILLASCYREKNQLIRARNLLMEIVEYTKNRKISPKLIAAYLPHAYLELSKIYEKKEQYEDARYYAITGIKILYCNAQLPYLVALQDQYIRLEEAAQRRQNMGKVRRKKLERIKEERKVIVELYKECGMEPYHLYSMEKYQNCYIFNELLERYRNFWNISKREFCGDICSTQAFSRIESDESCPVKTFSKWMERIGLPDTCYITQLHGANPQHIKKKIRIDNYIRKNQYQKAEVLFDKLEEDFIENQLITYCPENKQYFSRMKIILKRALHGLPEEEARKQLEETLSYTIPEYPNAKLENKPLFKQEVKILNSLAIGKAREMNSQEAIFIWETILKSYQNDFLYEFVEYDESNLVLINYNNIISSEGRYKESTEKIYDTIKKFLIEGTLDGIIRSCYNIAWNKEQEMLKQVGRIEKEEVGQIKFKQAKVVAEMLKNSFYIEFFKERNERFF